MINCGRKLLASRLTRYELIDLRVSLLTFLFPFQVKQKVDSYHLQLQNLLYEVMYLQKEINRCLEFRSKDEEIDLIPLKQFYDEAPLDITRPVSTCQSDSADLHYRVLCFN